MEKCFDVAIIGAGISGIAAAHHLKTQCPDKTFIVIEKKPTFGGTWHTFTYPGIRSDSDLYTFGYRFKPWTGKPVAEGHEILQYMSEVIEEDQLGSHIRYGHSVTKHSWSSENKRWTISTMRLEDKKEVAFEARFLFMCNGYFDHEQGYTPDFEGMDDFKGEIIHPQNWPENFDYTGKRIIVIGSGATAVTLVPNLADKAGHVTMLQRSPTYFRTHPNRNALADQLRKLDVPEGWTHEIVRRQVLADAKPFEREIFDNPEQVKRQLIENIREQVGDACDVDKHFTPRYLPWRQRIAYLPDGDLLKCVKSGAVSVVTDEVGHFARDGIETKSGEFIPADIIITATGFNMSGGGIAWVFDGKPIEFSSSYTWRGMMYSGIPNVVNVFGYLRTSWTMRVELICDLVCRLLNHMDHNNFVVCTPKLRARDQNMETRPWVDPDNFSPGYIMRAIGGFPKQGEYLPWESSKSYYLDRDEFPAESFEDGSLSFD